MNLEVTKFSTNLKFDISQGVDKKIEMYSSFKINKQVSEGDSSEQRYSESRQYNSTMDVIVQPAECVNFEVNVNTLQFDTDYIAEQHLSGYFTAVWDQPCNNQTHWLIPIDQLDLSIRSKSITGYISAFIGTDTIQTINPC